MLDIENHLYVSDMRNSKFLDRHSEDAEETGNCKQ